MKSKFFLFLFLAAAMVKPLMAQHAAGPLDGKQYKIELMKDGKLDSKETIIFDHGMMDPLDCHQWGFGPSDYEGKNATPTGSFHCTAKSEKEGTMIWQGKITGNEIEGMMLWSKEGQDPIQYSFKGEEAAPQK